MQNLNSTHPNSVYQNLNLQNLEPPKYLPLAKRKGKLLDTLQNDYFFKAVLQMSAEALRSLLCSLLRLRVDDISSVCIKNPIILGTFPTDKNIILDVKIVLNNNRIINLEMQRLNRGDWPERSLTYLCKTFDHLQHGESYKQVMPTQHIGILDFPLSHLPAEFYAHYYIMNSKTYEIYSDKLCLSVLNLSHIQLATEEDKQFRLDQWAALFKATTWEEIQMLTTNNPDFESIADALYILTEHRDLVEAYRRRDAEEAYQKQREELIQKQAHSLQEKDNTIQTQANCIAELERALAESKRQNGQNPFSKWKSLFHRH